MKWSATTDMPDLTGKVYLVTGSNQGIGYGLTKQLIRKGGHVVMACRSQAKADAAIDKIKSEEPDAPGSMEFIQLDTSDLKSVEDCAAALSAKHSKMHGIVLNAGIMMIPQQIFETRDPTQKIEKQLLTNHLGHFLLVGKLMSTIKATPGCRVVYQSSLASTMGNKRIMFEDLAFDKGVVKYESSIAYAQSKLSNLMTGIELDKRFKAAGVDALGLVVHPGFTRTNLQDQTSGGWKATVTRWITPILNLTPLVMDWEGGAQPASRALTDPEIKGAEFIGPSGSLSGPPVVIEPLPYALEEEPRKQLWEVSEKMCGLGYLD